MIERRELPKRPRSRQFDDELIGLDPEDPDAQAFAEHLDRMQQQRPTYTVEGYLEGVSRFAEASHRAQGLRYWSAVLVAGLLLAVAGYIVWESLTFVLFTWL